MFSTIPELAVEQSRTAILTAQTLPRALQQWHKTEAQIWAKIVLLHGTARYEVQGSADNIEAQQLSPAVVGIIVPLQYHRILPAADAQLQIIFYRETYASAAV